jgi:hypothetical protein
VPSDPFHLPPAGPALWNATSYSFAGWVPNVSGHLSFNLVDPHSGRPTYNYQTDLGSARTVALHRVRVAQDYPFYDWLVKIFRPSARQDFFLLGESGEVPTPYFSDGQLKEMKDGHGALVGAVAVLPVDSDPTTSKVRKALLRDAEERIDRAISDRALGLGNPSEQVAREVLAILQAQRSTVACYVMRFALFRTGELRIWFDLETFLGRDVVAVPPNVEEIEAAERLPAQAYYLIKDLLHAHYHHDPHSDQLLPLTKLSGGATEQAVSNDELRWRYVTLRGLARVIIELRQGKSLQGHKRALGIVAYAKAFQALLGKISRKRSFDAAHDVHKDIILYNFDYLEMSVNASDSAAESANSARLQLFAIEVGVLLSALAFWAGAVQIRPILCGENPKQLLCPPLKPGPIASVVNMIVANPIGFSIVLLALGFFAFIGIFRRTGAIPFAEKLIRWSSRLSEAVGVQISRWSRGSDYLGYGASLLLLASTFSGFIYLAYRLAPKTPVPPISRVAEVKSSSPWAPLYGMTGKPVDQSGLFTNSPVATDIRNLLGEDYIRFRQLVGEQSQIKREGDVVFVAPPWSSTGDGAYLLIDVDHRRIEAVLRQDNALVSHRTPGPVIQHPRGVQILLGGVQGSDAQPVPVETSGCTLTQGGASGRTLQLTGFLTAHDYCDFNVELQAGQSIAFDSRKAPGLNVFVLKGATAQAMGPIFSATSPGPQRIRVAWVGWNPRASEALKRRKFFVRLDVH